MKPRDQRTALCDALDAVEPSAPTLCEGWTAHDLAAHVWLRENRSLTVLPSLLRGRQDRIDQLRRQVMAERPYAALVQAIRQGPQGWSPFRIPGVEGLANTVEFFVHCEDVRRGCGDHTPTEPDPGLEELAWKRIPVMARLLLRRCPVAVWFARDLPPVEPLRIGRGPQIVTISGRPSELLLYLFGRREAAQVDLIGTPAALRALAEVELGV